LSTLSIVRIAKSTNGVPIITSRGIQIMRWRFKEL